MSIQIDNDNEFVALLMDDPLSFRETENNTIGYLSGEYVLKLMQFQLEEDRQNSKEISKCNVFSAIKSGMTVEKVTSFIKRKSFWGLNSQPFNISRYGIELSEIALSKERNEELIRHMSGAQIVQLHKLLKDEAFEKFTAGCLTGKQLQILSFFQKLPNMDMITIQYEIESLVAFLEGDASLFYEIIESIHKFHGNNDECVAFISRVEKDLNIIGGTTETYNSEDILDRLEYLVTENKYSLVNWMLQITKLSSSADHLKLRVRSYIFYSNLKRAEILYRFQDFPLLYSIAEEEYEESIDIFKLKQLIDYAESTGSKALRASCQKFFRKIYREEQLEVLAEFYEQWPLGKIPDMILEVIKE